MSASKPLTVSIPHRLGKEEARRRLRSGLGNLQTNYGKLVALEEEAWVDDHLTFRVRAIGQVAAGTIDVEEDYVRLEVTLPWLLAMLADKFTPMIRNEGTLMLEKK
jgi:hypothetical protein